MWISKPHGILLGGAPRVVTTIEDLRFIPRDSCTCLNGKVRPIQPGSNQRCRRCAPPVILYLHEEIWRRAKIMRVEAANGEWHCTLQWHKQSRCAHALSGSITLRLQTLQQFGVVFPNGVLVPESSSEDEMG